MVEESKIAGCEAAAEFGAEYVRHDCCCPGLDACAVSPSLYGDVRRSETRAALLGGIPHPFREALVRDLRLGHDGD
ncbi:MULTISPECIES: hypothetical protein [unclassified Streptomyces]|uniref:hypothetical protein n=1 Tax=unclassified Streptomyces TaxID=2593676 RepID=UPI00148944DC|nr:MULTISPECIES: hypothetical protein [unclassified Streptomyces]